MNNFQGAAMFAFQGYATFDVKINLLGLSVTRVARIRYSYTPSWPFFDAAKGEAVTLPRNLKIAFEIQARRPGRRSLSAAGPYGPDGWVALDTLLNAGLLSNGMLKAMLDQMDNDARQQDSERRGTVSSGAQNDNDEL